MTTFCLMPGPVRSANDGDWHRVGAPELARLYELEPGEWRVHDLRTADSCMHLRHLSPSLMGRYGRPS